MRMKRRQLGLGFTLVELMVALMVASVVLGAVATLASATACAKNATDEMGRQQAQLRCVTMRLTDLIRTANRVTSASADGFQLWHDNNADGAIDAELGELTDVTRGSDGNTLFIDNDKFFKTESHWQCKNVSFLCDTRHIAIWFDMDDNGASQTHTVFAKLRVSDDFY